MGTPEKSGIGRIGAVLFVAISFIGGLLVLRSLNSPWGSVSPISYAQAVNNPTATSTVTVGNAAPTVTNVTLNHATSIVLTANATTAVDVNATISDNNGCGDITAATASTTILIYRSGITSSTCLTTTDNLNCYRLTAFTASSTCSGGTQNTTTTFGVFYFAQATDSSSSFSTQNWIATVIFQDANISTGTSDSPGQELLTLIALNNTTGSINYGTLTASSTSGSTNQTVTSTNAGNASTSLRLSANQTLVSGSNVLATNTTQTYSTSSFTFQGTSTFLTDTVTTVGGFFLTSPTSTSNVSQRTFWGITIPAGTATGTYTGQTLFTALFQA